MNQRVLLIGGNYFPEPTGIGKYNGEMVDWLSENGYQCTVITTYPYYPHWKIQEPYTTKSFWFKKEVRKVSANSIETKIIRCPHYVPKNPSGAKRLIAELSILLSTTIALVRYFFSRKFDYILIVAPPFELGLVGVLYKKLKGAKLIYHIQDLQVDAARDLKMIKSQFIINLFLNLEKYILKNADFVSTISKGMIKKIKNKCDREVVFFPNWVDTDFFKPISDKSKLKIKFGYTPDDKVFLYSGAIGEKQGLESIIYAAKNFENIQHLKFLICGSGPYKGHLVNLKDKLQLHNLSFCSLQPLEDLNSFLNMADFHLILQKAKASDLVMPSKLNSILSVGGVSIVSANEGTSLYEIIKSSNMGMVIIPENQDALNDAIATALQTNHFEMANNARNYAVKYLTLDKILFDFAEDVLQTRKLKSKNKVQLDYSVNTSK